MSKSQLQIPTFDVDDAASLNSDIPPNSGNDTFSGMLYAWAGANANETST
jgi:hypothetical protein